MAPTVMTADQLLHASIPDKRTELVRGVLVVREPTGCNHGRVIAQLTGRLWSHVERAAAGQLLGAETGFTLFRDPDTVRAPDIAFLLPALSFTHPERRRRDRPAWITFSEHEDPPRAPTARRSARTTLRPALPSPSRHAAHRRLRLLQRRGDARAPHRFGRHRRGRDAHHQPPRPPGSRGRRAGRRATVPA